MDARVVTMDVAGVVVMTLAILIALAAWGWSVFALTGRQRTRPGRWARRRTMHRFARAVAAGDLLEAERCADAVLSAGGDPTPPGRRERGDGPDDLNRRSSYLWPWW